MKKCLGTWSKTLLFLLLVGCFSNGEEERSVYVFFYSPTPSPYLVFKGRWEFSGFLWLWEAVSVLNLGTEFTEVHVGQDVAHFR